MDSLKQYIDQMHQLLDQLIETAKNLRDASKRVFSEEELAPLQKHQEDVLHHLEQIDQALHRFGEAEIPAATHEQFHAKLIQFQELNQEFINNLNNSHGLIQF